MRLFLPCNLRLLRTVLLPALLFAVNPAEAQSSNIKFTLVDGVGEVSLGKITGITQDTEGYMWFADQDKSCITRYDGYSMRSYRYDPANPSGLGGSYPETIYCDDKGYLWIGFYGMGLDRFDPKTETFTHYRYRPSDPGSISSDTVSVVTMDRKGKLWIGTSNGVDVLDPVSGAIEHYRHDPGQSGSLDYNMVRSIFIDGQGTVWVGTGIVWDHAAEGGLNRFNSSTQRFTHTLASQKIRALLEDSRGKVWAGGIGNKLYNVDKETGKVISQLVIANPLTEEDHITFIREDGAGLLWIGTLESGVIRFDPISGSIARYGDGQGMMDTSGWQAYTSREGVLWFSTQASNLYRVDPSKKPFNFSPTKSGVLAFTETSKDQIWLSTFQGLIFQHTWGTPAYVEINGGSAGGNNSFWAFSQLLPDGAGGHLLLHDEALYRIEGEHHLVQPILHDSDLIRRIAPADSNHCLVATISGLYKLDLTTKEKNRIPGTGRNLNALCVDHNSNIWAGYYSNDGLSCIDRTGKPTNFLKGRSINAIFEGSEGNIWVGTPNGVYLRRTGQPAFSLIQLKGSQIGTADVYGFAQDDSGYIWLSSRSGIFQLDEYGNQLRVFGSSQGINCSMLTGAVFKRQSGDILVGSKAGYYSFDPLNTSFPSPAPQIVLRELKVAGQLMIPTDGVSSVTLQHNQDVFSIGFAGIHFSNPGENIHLYKLENYDADWRKAGAERTAYYFNVPPGKYVFKVRVGNNDGSWAEKSLPIEVVPAWWDNLYFKLFSALLIIALLYLAVRWRTRMQFRRQLEKSKTEQQLSELQRRSSELEMQALRSQMNPHFLFNSLNAVNRFILQNDSTQASAYLTKFSRLIRFILQNSEQAMVPLEHELDALELYLELEALRFEEHFTYSVQVDPSVEKSVVQVPPLIIQPYAENAIWHGLMHKETPGHLEILLHRDHNWLYCIIRDNGIGRKRAGELKSKSASLHKSMGMKITAGRMELLKKQHPYASAITINDPIRRDGTAAGTEVILKIPLKYD